LPKTILIKALVTQIRSVSGLFASKTLKAMERTWKKNWKNDPRGAEERERQERKRIKSREYDLEMPYGQIQ